MIHPLAWAGWAGAILVTVSMTRNPFYLGLVLFWIALSSLIIEPAAESAPIPISPLYFGLVVVILSTLFNGATVHVGRTVLFRLPDILPLVGGPITLEAIVYGALNGLTLSGMFAAFTIINKALPVRAVVRLIPQAFYPVAVVASIAITFVPTTLRQFQQIREAQAVRGHRLRGLRDWLPLMMPLLVGGLERALQLAEAMMARGFASSDKGGHGSLIQVGVILGLIGVLSGWLLRLIWGRAVAGLILLLAGIGLILAVLWVVGRRTPRTLYRPQPWTGPDWLVVAGAGLMTVAFLWTWPGRDTIFYYPYPALSWPEFGLAMGLATAGLLGPALVQIWKQRLNVSSS